MEEVNTIWFIKFMPLNSRFESDFSEEKFAWKKIIKFLKSVAGAQLSEGLSHNKIVGH